VDSSKNAEKLDCSFGFAQVAQPVKLSSEVMKILLIELSTASLLETDVTVIEIY